MAYIKFEGLKKVRQKYKNKKVVFCSGSFDLLHAGHILFLEDCKALGDILVIGIGSSRSIQKYKSKAPIINEVMRIKMLDSLRVVDYVFLDLTNNILTLLEQVLPELKPNYYVVNTDAKMIPDRKKVAKHYGIKMITLERKCPPEYKNISTTNIINKIRNS